GYEEAAAQGLMAAINSVHMIHGKEPLILSRAQAYIGVLIDDLVTCGTKEPYRLFTSRAEYRLLLREDNADSRLCEIGHEIGLLQEEDYHSYLKKQTALEQGVALLESIHVKPNEATNTILMAEGTVGLKQKCKLSDLLRRPELTLAQISLLPTDPHEGQEAVKQLVLSDVRDEIQLQVKFQGYLKRQEEQVARFKKMEAMELPEEIDYKTLSGLSNEVVEKLSKVRPRSLGQASRISGITPAAISVLQVHLKKLRGHTKK
ncbi:MAG TPA: tRNA uridine-5-carboxymethylaminomethyl(34) synthesis enzyme MnmG, partial [Desulfocapsa sulfexigens]|nr:tRNA uridine-5-carboxymethylaminomethyl(34) synthesis enzyme MnmG [Desulfocapsa sulfexigens]